MENLIHIIIKIVLFEKNGRSNILKILSIYVDNSNHLSSVFFFLINIYPSYNFFKLLLFYKYNLFIYTILLLNSLEIYLFEFGYYIHKNIADIAG